jgi:hypothetical protein
LDISLRSLSVDIGQIAQDRLQVVPLRLAEIDPIALGENVEQEDGNIRPAAKRHHPIAAALAVSASGKSQLSRAAGAWDFDAGYRPRRSALR